MRLAMVGTGYVGLVTGACLANTGNHVACVDIDEPKIARLNKGEIPIYEPGLEDLIGKNHKAGRLTFTTEAPAAYQRAEIIFLCVGTPSDARGEADLRALFAAAGPIGQAIEQSPAGSKPKIVVIKSTVPVGTSDAVRKTIAGQTSRPFYMASNPEFLKEGAAIADFNKPDRVVLGVDHEAAGRKLRQLYEPFVRQGHPIHVMDISSAEMVKYASNTMLATKISFINEIAGLCEAFGADIDQVRLGMCADRRIGNQFLYPGLGYGGSCFPKDVLACIGMGRSSQTPAHLLEAVDTVNRLQRTRFIEKIRRFFNDKIAGLTFAVWGLAFKPCTDDMREAPAVTIIEHLLEAGAVVCGYDAAAAGQARKHFGNRITLAETPMKALSGADALIICTDWDEFKQPDFEEMKNRMKQPVIFDGRNLYHPDALAEAGFNYVSVGRKQTGPK